MTSFDTITGQMTEMSQRKKQCNATRRFSEWGFCCANWELLSCFAF